MPEMSAWTTAVASSSNFSLCSATLDGLVSVSGGEMTNWLLVIAHPRCIFTVVFAGTF